MNVSVVINPCIMYLECIYGFNYSFLGCIIVLPLVVLHDLPHVSWHLSSLTVDTGSQDYNALGYMNTY